MHTAQLIPLIRIQSLKFAMNFRGFAAFLKNLLIAP
jgi:hypothetical protein